MGALVPAGLECRSWQVGRALLSTECVLLGDRRGESTHKERLSAPGPCALQRDVFQAEPSVSSPPQEAPRSSGAQGALSGPRWCLVQELAQSPGSRGLVLQEELSHCA